MRIKKERCFPALFLLIFLTVIFPLQREIEFAKNQSPSVSNLQYMPSGDQLRFISLAWKEAIADILWIRALNFIPISDNDPDRRGYDWFYGIVNRVTDLDPRFGYAYYVGGLILSIKSDRVDLSNVLLEKGLKRGPKDWNIPYLLGFNYVYHLKAPLKAARYFQLASQQEDSPRSLPFIAVQLLVEGGRGRVALSLLEKMYRDTNDDSLKKIIKKRIENLRVELGLL